VTTLGRVQLAMQAIGNGADVKITLYPDSSGNPNTSSPLASTIMPASQIAALGAPGGLALGPGAMATPFSNILMTGPITQIPWGTSSTSASGLITSTSTANYGSYIIMAGGTDSNTSTAVSNVFSVPITGTGAGAAITQPSLPQALANLGIAASVDSVVTAGGFTGSATVTSVYTSSWNSNTGALDSWAAQTSIPVALDSPQVAIYNDSTVYVIGGFTGTSAVATVYIGSMQNQQITSWTSGPPLPVAGYAHVVGIVGNIIVVAGGVQTPTGAALSATYWSYINPNGSLVGWQTGPSMQLGVAQFDGNTFVADSGLFVVGGFTVNGSPGTMTNDLQSLTVTANGLGAWQRQQYAGSALSLPSGGFANGDGTYTLVSLGNQAGGFTNYSILYTVPFISVPLPATGLTAGGTYHVVIQQQRGDASNYIQLGQVNSSLEFILTSLRLSNGPWFTQSGYQIMMNTFDLTASNPIIHTWHDPDSSNTAAATTTSLYTSRNLLLGYCENYAQPTGTLNINPTFTSGVSPWTAVNGTITQSSAQTHGGFAFSGLLTPTGGFTQAFAQSELIPVIRDIYGQPALYYTNGWFFSPTGWANFALDVNWFDQNQNFISTSSSNFTLTINTWTNCFDTFQAPETAAYLTIDPDEFGSPGPTNLLYMSDVTINLAYKTTFSSVAAIEYGTGIWPPIGVTQLN